MKIHVFKRALSHTAAGNVCVFVLKVGEIMEKIEREGSAVVRRPPFLVAGDRNYLWQNSSSRLSLFPFGVGKAKKKRRKLKETDADGRPGRRKASHVVEGPRRGEEGRRREKS